MRINRLKLRNFRNYRDCEIHFAPHLNLITGANGAGKTNIIDAIHYLCMSRSFVAASDQYVANWEEKYFMIEGDFEGEIRQSFKVSCSYSRGEGKKIFVNDSPLPRLSDLIGMVPVVVMSPDDLKLTAEGPAERRSFLDSMISQISSRYLRDLMKYRHIRKQRNKLLQEFRGPRDLLETYLEPWSLQLVETGSRLIAKRSEVLQQFKRYLEFQYQTISELKMKPDLTYQTVVETPGGVDQIADAYKVILHENLEKEIDREQTLYGPHRDEVVFYLDEMELRNFGSQGQHRLFSMALKMAQLFYYTDQLDDLPIMLLDDLFGNLDQQKVSIIMEALTKHSGQTFITSAAEKPFLESQFKDNSSNHWYTVENENIQTKF